MTVIEHLNFSYGDKVIFSDFSAEISAPVTCLTAPSGGGKTTLLRLIAGLLCPDSGRIVLPEGRISYMFQEDRLLPWLTARENVEAVLSENEKARAGELLKLCELADEADKQPAGMSGGQCRRVALARSLAFDGGLLLLDEPFKGLDASLTERLVPHILKSGAQIIMTSHSPEEAKLMGASVLALK